MFKSDIKKKYSGSVIYEAGDITIPVMCVNIDGVVEDLYCATDVDLMAFLRHHLVSMDWQQEKDGKQIHINITIQKMRPDEIEDMDLYA